MFSLFNNKDIEVRYKDKNTFIFIGSNYENREEIIDRISSYTKFPLHLIFVDSSNEHLFRLSQEIAQSCSTMYPGNNKYIILDNEDFREQFGRFGETMLLVESYDLKRFNKEFNICDDNRVQIQCGCINRCRFCVNEQHKSISIPHLDIIEEIKLLHNKDVFLSGINITSYNDGEVSLAGLCKTIIENCKDIKSLRLAGLDLQQFEEVKEVIEAIKGYDKIYPIFHFPIHTCNSELLERNELDYTRDQIEEIMGLCRDNHILYSWDIICGLPGETEEMFNDTLKMVKRHKPVIVYIYSFRYLSGAGYKEDDLIDSSVIKQRCYKLASVISGYKEDILRQIEDSRYKDIKEEIKRIGMYIII